MSTKLEQALTMLFEETISELRAKIKSGEATASDYKNVIELLKNNGITAELKKGEIPDGLLDDLPFVGENTIVQ